MKGRHLEPRRPRKDRDVTWSRAHTTAGMIRWTFWRRDRRNAVHMLDVALTLDELEAARSGIVFATLRASRRRLRDFVDEIDLRHMETKA